MNINQHDSPNKEIGRRGNSPKFITIHISEGTESQVNATFMNGTEPNPVSAHYLVCNDGHLDHFVQEEDTAWHCGIVVNPTAPILRQYPFINPNLISVGIEHEGWTDINEAQYHSSAEIIEQISSRWGIPLDAEHIITHHSIRSTKTCPANIDVNRLIKMANNIRNGVSNQVPDRQATPEEESYYKGIIKDLIQKILAILQKRK